ncbi:Uncharacterised protein [Serratia plymuthica]|nr:Uncharacterised protein [Serratia plymuthica]VEI19465.1 Uncharacterised protein [Serratia plymuthica]
MCSTEKHMMADGCPIIGFTGDATGVYVAVMHPAVTCAATLGRMISEELVTGKSLDMLENYRPARFFSAQG